MRREQEGVDMSSGDRTNQTEPADGPGFHVRGVSHLALVCSDMAATVDFYSGVLGMPLIMTLGAPIENFDGHQVGDADPEPGMAPGTQHFFFDMGNGDSLAFFWFPNGKPTAPGIAYPDSTSQTSADGSMHHLAFEVSSDSLAEVWQRLESKNVPFYFLAHSIEELSSYRTDAGIDWATSPANKVFERRRRIREGVTVDTLSDVNEDTYLASFYFSDPDGINLELAAWCEPAYSKALASRNEKPTRSGGRSRWDRIESLVGGRP
jgi:catechol 2,3-dioxygenase-like lactoylglutathione lyase family enzyme